MKKDYRISERVASIPENAIDEMTKLSNEIDDVSFFSWAKPTSGTPEYIEKAAVDAIERGLVGGYSGSLGIPPLRCAIAEKLRRDNKINAASDEVMCDGWCY